MKDKQKPKYSIPQNVAYAVKLAWKHSKLLLVMTVTSAVVSMVTNLVQLYIAPVILKKVEQAVPLAELLGTIAVFTLALLLCQSLQSYLDTTEHIGTNRIGDALSMASMRRGCMTSYPNQLDPKFRGRQNEALRAVVGDSEIRMDHVFPQTVKICTAILGFVIYLFVLKNLNDYLMLAVVATTVIGYFVGKRSNEWAYTNREESVEIRLHRNYIINLAMGNEMPKDIRIFGMRGWLDEVYDGIVDLWKGFCSRREKKLMAAKAVDVILSFARNGIAYIYLIHMALNEGLSASDFLLYFSAVTGFTNWITTILNNASSLHKTCLLICEIREYMEWPEPFRFEEGKPVSKADSDRYELRLEDVSFRYPESEKDTITHMNLTLHPGEKLAIVGLNGAGKTTLIKLLCGLLDPTEGRVLLNGQDIREFNRRDYYSLFTAVFQDFSRLQASIAQNVAQSVDHIDKGRLAKCVEQAGLSDVIADLPRGVDTMLGKIMSDDGIELSGGQLQRLMLARALYKDAPILLLDEPTAALDPIAENTIYQKYNDMTHGRTSVYISHRLASTRFCDRILFLENGNIAEEGTHDELMALGGGYCDLFNVQSKYYREGGTEDEE